jgi:hypothetical protein
MVGVVAPKMLNLKPEKVSANPKLTHRVNLWFLECLYGFLYMYLLPLQV